MFIISRTPVIVTSGGGGGGGGGRRRRRRRRRRIVHDDPIDHDFAELTGGIIAGDGVSDGEAIEGPRYLDLPCEDLFDRQVIDIAGGDRPVEVSDSPIDRVSIVAGSSTCPLKSPSDGERGDRRDVHQTKARGKVSVDLCSKGGVTGSAVDRDQLARFSGGGIDPGRTIQINVRACAVRIDHNLGGT